MVALRQLNVAIQPGPQTVDRLRRFTRYLSDLNETRFVVDHKRLFFHMTLIMFPEPDTLNPKKLLASPGFSFDGSDVSCEAVGVAITERGYIEVSYKNTRRLRDLQELLANHLRGSAVDTSRYELLGDNFRPHVTLGRLCDDQDRVLLPMHRSWRELSFTGSRLHLFIANDQGQAVHSLDR